ncbi:MAG: carboxypeptidase M32, partial [Solobacterium sp.]|nr:carboxypeptidase M32 [Solobacterium sp.]
MTKEEKIQKYKEWIFKVSAYRMALAVLNLDKLTVAPTAGAAFRDERTAYLAGEAFSITNDPEMFEIVKEFKDDESLDEEIRRSAYLYYRNMESTMCIPKDEYIEMSKLMNQSYDAWLEAKTKNDYSIFEPYLKKVIEAKKKVYAYRNKDIDLYDQMLDDYEPGMNQEKYDAFFEQIKERLLPFIQKVTKAKQLDDSFNRLQYPKNKQKEYTEHLLHYLQFDSSWGYQNESEHPFTSWTCE